MSESLKLIIILFLALTLYNCKSTSQLNVAPEKVGEQAKVPVLKWDKTHVDFGELKKGDQRKTEYMFTNVSDIPISIELATTCHCTTLEFPPASQVFKKGDSGVIKAIFDSSEKDKSEKIDITIILANTDSKGYPIIEELFFSYTLIP